VSVDCVCCSWDEWVPESRVLKISDASRQKQKELQNAHMWVIWMCAAFYVDDAQFCQFKVHFIAITDTVISCI